LEQSKKALVSGTVVWLVYAALLWLVWGKYELLLPTCILMAGAVGCLGLIRFYPKGPVFSQPEDPQFSGRWTQAVWGCLGLYCAWRAAQEGISGQLPAMALWMAGSALVWRVAVLEPLPAIPSRLGAALLFALVAVGALFRLYRAGAIPVGLTSRDESLIWNEVWQLVDGLRPTYYNDPAGGDGIMPFYMIMAGVKAFGCSILAFRLEGILVSIAMTGLFYRMGKETLGAWAGMAAAFFWAVSLWPVTVARAPYFMTETMLMVVGCLAMLAVALRKGGAWRFACAGLLWAFCFNVYPAARVMLALVPWLYVLAWISRKDARPALGGSVPPLALGFAVGIAPVLLWLATSPGASYSYFAAFNQPIQAGALAPAGLLGRMNETLARVLSQFPARMGMLTQTGPAYCVGYFPTIYPTVHPWLFSLAVLGACVALARFRNVFYAFMLYWWFIGILPAAAADPSFPSDRRTIMVLPPTLLLAAIGSDTVARVARAWLGKARVAGLILAALGIAAAAGYGAASWRDYFVRNQRDPGMMMNGQPPTTEMFRAVRAAVGPEGLLISTWHPTDDSFYQPDTNDWWGVALSMQAAAMERGINVYWYKRQADGVSTGGGFVDALRWALKNSARPGGPPEDVWVLLVPFYDHLEPGLRAIGAEVVSEVRVPVSSLGPLAYTGMAKHPYRFARLLRIRGLDPAKVEQYARRPQFKVTLQQLAPPRGWDRDQVRGLNQEDPLYRQIFASYERSRSGWTGLGSETFTTDDPWFWQADAFGGGFNAPYRLQIRARLAIPRDGDYAFGASASIYTKLLVDGKKVYERDPLDPANKLPYCSSCPGAGITWYPDDPERRGFLGRPVHLAQGQHLLEIDQAQLSTAPYYSQVLRPVWSYAGQEAQTLPLEVLSPP
jgi:4-amino-4-deoxy-L-arabinose transferase-like glycosyltransferase